MTGDDAGRRREVIALLSFRKDVGHIVSLVAPGVHVDRRKENSEGAVDHNPQFRQVVRETKPGREFQFVRIVQSFGISLLTADENERHTILEYQIGVSETNVLQGTHILIAQTDLDRGVARHLKTVLNKSVDVPLPELHLRDARLALLHRGEAQQKTRERRAGTVIGCRLCGETVGELIEAAILKEAPHGPDEIAKTATNLQTMSSDLPTHSVAGFEDRVP